ncbi:MAG: hypothetical protein LUG16_03535, partial [Candidatus Gastranaerophilales bacterium]|nr:hypothetical protein [Candidatus Gastranaerophilales bacterium]
MTLRYKKLISILIIFFVSFIFTSGTIYAETNTQKIKNVEKERKVLKQKINSLARLEKIETSKLS